MEHASLEWLVAHEEIRQLVARYAFSVDSRDLDNLVSLFVEDVAVGKQASGREALKAWFSLGFEPLGFTILNTGTHVIEIIDDDHASGELYCKAEISHGNRLVHQAILYRDRYERRDGTWLFARRDHLLWYATGVGENPIGLASMAWPKEHEGRGTVPECFPTYVSFTEALAAKASETED
ncbi:MAG: nuclear transport factor 2 family protein [Actinobacteria bacterium]|nr:nuclear transport factor 2 family protein [Actinomycetota bacterium]